MEALVAWQLKAAVILAVALGAWLALRNAPSHWRRRVLGWGMVAAVLVPLLGMALGSVSVAVPVQVPTAVADAPMPSLAVLADDATANAATPAAAPQQSSEWSWATMVLGLWLVGALIGVVRVAAGLVGSRWLLARSHRAPSRIADLHRALCRETEADCEVRLHDRPAVPIVLGIVRPVVVLPSIASRWSTDTLRAVLLHELGHVRNTDARWFPVVALVRAVLWLDPLVWLVTHRFHREAEFAADDAAVATSMRPSTYAAELLGLSQVSLVPLRSIPAPALGHPRMKERITRILQSPASLVRMRTIVPVALGSVGALVTVMVLRASAPDSAEAMAAMPTTTTETAAALGLPTVPGSIPTVAVGAGPRVDLTPTQLRLAVQPNAAPVQMPMAAGRLPDAEVKNHLIERVYEGLDNGDVPGERPPLVLAVHPEIPWSTVVDAAYTAGRSGFRRYWLAVDQGGIARAIDVSPPLFHAEGMHPATPVPLPLVLRVEWTAEGQRDLDLQPNPLADSEGAVQHWSGVEPNARALATVAQQACGLAHGGAVDLVVAPRNAVPYGEVIDTMAALHRECGGGITIEGGSE